MDTGKHQSSLFQRKHALLRGVRARRQPARISAISSMFFLPKCSSSPTIMQGTLITLYFSFSAGK